MAKRENTHPLEEEYVMAIFAIRGHRDVDRSTATYRATGNNLEKSLKFLDFVREKQKLDAKHCRRLEVKEERHLNVQELIHSGYTDRAAYLALSQNSWDLEKARMFLESEREKRESKRKLKKVPAEKIPTKKEKSKSSEKCQPQNNIEVSESLLDLLERETQTNRATCRRIFTECGGNMETTRARLYRRRDDVQQRLMRSEEKQQARESKEKCIERLADLTGYTHDKCEKILAHFGGDYAKAEKQYKKFLNKKEGGEKINLDNEEINLMTDFRIKELDLTERRDLEQYFFSRDTLVEIVKMMDNFDNPCCMVCPSVAHVSHYLNRELTLLDIDDRFSYLPRYIKYNLYRPSPLTQTFDMILFDPPYFQVPMPDLVHSVDTVARHDTDTFLIVGFLRRSELALLRGFSKYKIHPTGYHPGYAHVKPTKRRNYLFYSNWDGLPNNSQSIL